MGHHLQRVIQAAIHMARMQSVGNNWLAGWDLREDQTLAFWTKRPLVSSFEPTVEVKTSVPNNHQKKMLDMSMIRNTSDVEQVKKFV